MGRFRGGLVSRPAVPGIAGAILFAPASDPDAGREAALFAALAASPVGAKVLLDYRATSNAYTQTLNWNLGVAGIIGGVGGAGAFTHNTPDGLRVLGFREVTDGVALTSAATAASAWVPSYDSQGSTLIVSKGASMAPANGPGIAGITLGAGAHRMSCFDGGAMFGAGGVAFVEVTSAVASLRLRSFACIEGAEGFDGFPFALGAGGALYLDMDAAARLAVAAAIDGFAAPTLARADDDLVVTFTPTAGQTDFSLPNAVHAEPKVYVNGIRYNSSNWSYYYLNFTWSGFTFLGTETLDIYY